MKYLRIIAIAAAVLLSFGTASAQSADEVPNYNMMQSLINAGTFIQSNSACNFTGYQATTVSVFTSCIQNNGSCAGASNSLMTYSAMVACRVLGTLQSASVYFSGEVATSTADIHGTQTCRTTSAVTTYTLPANTVAPTSAATAIAWYPNGQQNQTYTVEFINPSGTVAYSPAVPSTSSTARIAFYAAGQPGGAWEIAVTGLAGQYCSGSQVVGLSVGIAPGTAEWYAP